MKWKNWKGGLVFAMLGLLILLCLMDGKRKEIHPLTYVQFWQMAEDGLVQSVTVGEGEMWQATLQDGTLARTPNPRAIDGKERLLSLGVDVKEQAAGGGPGLWLALGLGFFLLLAFRGKGKGASMGLQKYAAVQADETIPDITFQDVAAAEDTLQNMRDLADFLRDPQRFARCGARMPRGVILYGPPGTGKTLLAKALAGEAKAPFFAMSGADFVQVYVGVGASRVREVFKKARKAGGGVIFIDEIDAIGKKRDNGNDEREQTLNALLTEMSGFSTREGVLVLAATNRLDTLDGALLREGRFDRRIEVGLPDYEERLKILTVHARKKPLCPSVSLEDMARATALFSGAQLEALLNEAAIRAARRGGEIIEQKDMDQAFYSITVGEERPRPMTQEEKRITAYHEAGHALLTRILTPSVCQVRLTVIPSSRGAAGYAMSIRPDKMLHTRKELMHMLCTVLGGRAAEEMIFGKENVTTGAAGDLKKAAEIAGAMAGEFGMGETGDEGTDRRLIQQQAMEMALAVLKEHQHRLHALAGALMEKETLDEEEILHWTA